jgi:tetratricopeptide (TPR) repeat protein
MSLWQPASSAYRRLISHLSKWFYIVILAIVLATIAFVGRERLTLGESPVDVATTSRISWVLFLVGSILGGLAFLPGQDHPQRKQALGIVGLVVVLGGRLLTPFPVSPPKDISGVKATIINTDRPAVTISPENAKTAHQILKSRPDPEQIAEGELALSSYSAAIDHLGPVEGSLEDHLADIHFYKARALWALAQSDIALPNHEIFKKVLQEADLSLNFRPTYSPALVIKCVALRDTGQIDEALTVCDDAVGADRSNVGAWTAKGAALIYKGDSDHGHARHFYEEALADLEIGISTRSTRELWANKALALEGLGRDEEALQAIRHALNISPDFTNALVAEGTILKRLNRLPEAVEIYREIANLHPSDAEVWNNLGDATEMNEDLQGALIYFDKALRLKPDLGAALFNKGEVLDRLSRYEEAIPPLQEECTRDSQDAEARYELAFALFKIGKTAEAESLIADALRLNPRYPAPRMLRNAIRNHRVATLDSRSAPSLLPSDVGLHNDH